MLLFDGESTVAIGVDQSNDVRVSFFPATILENLHIYARWVVLAQMRSDLDRAMDHVVVPDKSADETDDDDRIRRRNRFGGTCRTRDPRVSGRCDEAENKRNATD